PWQPGLYSAIFCLISEPLSSVSSLEVHFDLLDLTELTDMSDQELGEVFADSDEENHTESPASESALRLLHPQTYSSESHLKIKLGEIVMLDTWLLAQFSDSMEIYSEHIII
uniref:Dysbindin domain-containing protein 1 n=1 Tax=Sinocyclocheilus anshuiensis TaxID=1608454 RepID=A0A671R893_9TELE